MRDNIEAFHAADTIPIGINPGDAASHRQFVDEHNFSFDLLVDEDRMVAQRYDAIKPDGSGIQRTVVLVGKNGKIIFRAVGAPPPAELLEVLRDAQDAV